MRINSGLKYFRNYSGFSKKAKDFLRNFIYAAGSSIFLLKKKNINLVDKEIIKILVISLYFRGDVLFNTPVYRLLKLIFPKSLIDVWVKSRSKDVLENNPFVNEVLVFDSVRTSEYSEDGRRFDLIGKINFIRKLRSKNYDLILDLTGLMSTAMITFLSNPKFSAGNNYQGFGFIYNNDVKYETRLEAKHLIEKYLDIARLVLRISDEKYNEFCRNDNLQIPEIVISEQTKKNIDDEFSKLSIYKSDCIVTIHLSAGWKAKMLPLETFNEVIKHLRRPLIKVVIVGSAADMNLIVELDSFKNNELILFLDRSLNQVAEVIRRSKIFIGSDSIPLHIAGTVGTKSIGLFGPTNPRFSNPDGVNHAVIYKELFCSAKTDEQYCSRNAGKTCPTIDCMNMITAGDIIDKLKLMDAELSEIVG